jgi:hypothetical protein
LSRSTHAKPEGADDMTTTLLNLHHTHAVHAHRLTRRIRRGR